MYVSGDIYIIQVCGTKNKCSFDYNNFGFTQFRATEHYI